MEKKEFINYLKRYLPYDCSIELTAKNKEIININKKLFKTHIKIHPVFLKANKNLLHDIINFILNKNQLKTKISEKNIKEFYNLNRIRRKTKVKIDFKYKNIYSEFLCIIDKLVLIFPEINFQILRITWGRKNNKKNLKSIRLGSYDLKNNIIRIHPILDSPKIPDYFIHSIIYHELTHFILFYNKKNQSLHDKNFYNLLKQIDTNFHKSKKWEKTNIFKIIQDQS